MPVDPAQVEEIFHLAITMPKGTARTAYLDQACGENVDLRRSVDGLLAAHDAAGSFLDLDDADRTLEAAHPLSEGAGTLIGRYKLLEQIGEGGFGVVFMAEQEQPVRRRVALKIIKLGMDTKQVVARFEAERQALAMMDHPNIAKVFDGGSTNTGRPYFVMELVKGVPITQYCDDNKLTTQERLNLFTAVCNAVQHAHQKGIIHRDLKPSNVLVTMHDDKPVPKIIDFGIAKATQGRLTEKTLFTQFRQLIGTPTYMSPEQAQITGMDIDTRSDIYSLGVLLYELLTGRTPFDPKELLSVAYDEMRRIIREVDPPQPSTRLSSLDNVTLKTLADQRKSDPKNLARSLQGDLDWIVMKCLEKDRARRYETANSLSRDIERFLNEEPVEASPPSTIYRLRKLAHKHRRPLTVAAIIAFLLIAGTLTSTWLAIHASRAQVLANANALRADRESENARTYAADLLRGKSILDKRLYLSDMLLAQSAWGTTNVPRFLELLDRNGPGNREGADLRDFEWYYWWRVSHPRQIRWNEQRAHEGDCYDVCVSPDMKYLALFGGGWNIQICDAVTGRQLHQLPTEWVYSFCFSPDSRRLAFASDDSDFATDKEQPHEGPVIAILDVDSGEVIQRIPGQTGTVNRICFSPNGKLLASASIDETVRIWDTATGLQVRTIDDHIAAQSVAFSPNGSRLAAIDARGNIRIWDVFGKEECRLEASPPASDDFWLSVAFSPDGKRIACNIDNNVHIWDIPSRQHILTLTEQPGGTFSFDGRCGPLSFCFSPDGARLATGNGDCRVRVWDLATGRETLVLAGHTDGIHYVHFSPDGNQLLSASFDGTVRFWDAINGQSPVTITGNLTLTGGLYFNADAQRLTALNIDGTIHTFNAKTAKEISAIRYSETNVSCACLSPDRRRLAFAADSKTKGSADILHLTDANSGEEIYIQKQAGTIHRMQYSSDGRRIAVSVSISDSKSMIAILDAATGKLIISIPKISVSLCFSPDGRTLAAGDADRGVILWDAASGNERLVLSMPVHFETADSISFSADGQRIAAANGKWATVWNSADGESINDMTEFAYDASICLSPDGRRLASAGVNAIRLWDVDTGEEAILLKGHSDSVQTLAFSPDGKRLASADIKGTIKIWDATLIQDSATIPFSLPPTK